MLHKSFSSILPFGVTSADLPMIRIALKNTALELNGGPPYQLVESIKDVALFPKML